MILLDFLFAFFLALVLVSLLTGPGRWRHPRLESGRAAGFFLFLVLLPLIWALGVWLSPMGPEINGSYWMPTLLAGILIALLVLSIGSAKSPPTLHEDTAAGVEPDVGEVAVIGITAVFGVFFWLLLLGAVAVITAFYAI